MQHKINVVVVAELDDLSQEIDLVESVKEIVRNISIDNLVMLANKSRKKGINETIKKYQKFM